jgi:hypothetical protein
MIRETELGGHVDDTSWNVAIEKLDHRLSFCEIVHS